MTQRLLTFNKEECKYLLLNIIAHDVIHDYGNADSGRWDKVQKLLSGFYRKDNIFKGGDKRNFSETQTQTQTQAQTTTVFNPFIIDNRINNRPSYYQFPGTANVLSQLEVDKHDEFCIEPEIKSFIDNVQSEIIMAFFHIFLTKKQRNLKDYIEFISYIPAFNNNDNNINNIFSDISDLFYYYILNDTRNKTKALEQLDTTLGTKLDIELLFMLLSDFFKKYHLELRIVIYSYVDFIDNTEHQYKKRKVLHEQNGGVPRDTITDTNAINLMNDIKPIFKNPENIVFKQVLEMKKICEETREKIGDVVFQKQAQEKFNQIRESVIKELTSIFENNNAIKYAKSLENIRLMNDRNVRNLDVDDVYNVINTAIDVPYKIAQKKEAVDLAKQQQIEKDIRAAQSGNLTSEDKTLVGNFMKLISKMGLQLTGCLNDNKTIVYKSNDNTLQTELDILSYIAGFESRIKNKNLDDTLIDYFDNQTQDKYKYEYKFNENVTERIDCRSMIPSKYVINNAAPIGSMANNAFCPFTSIIDGMSQCSWNTAQQDGIEYGNMDFLINDGDTNSLYYNGKITIVENSNIDKNGIPYQIAINVSINFPGYGKVNGIKPLINVNNQDDLEAPNVLKKTLLAILSINDSSIPNIWDHIFKNFTTTIPDPYKTIETPIPLFDLIYREILFKGVGDLFQEINAVAKYGGYTMDNYECSQKINSYKKTLGNQIRCFLANDRPSGTRFIYMLLNGKKEEINEKAFGGYYSAENMVLAKRSTNVSICSNIKGGTHRKNPNKKTYKKNESISKKNRKSRKTRKHKKK